jgi:Na+-driven multidrug efflux pump
VQANINSFGALAMAGCGSYSKVEGFAFLPVTCFSMALATFVSQNVGAGNPKRAQKAMLTGIGVGLMFGCAVFALVMFRGDLLAGVFSTDAEVVQKGFEYLKGFAPETIVTAILFSMVGYFNGNNKTLWVMIQGLVQTLLVRLPMAYFMSIQPNASLTKIGLAAPVSTTVGVVLNIAFYMYLNRAEQRKQRTAA